MLRNLEEVGAQTAVIKLLCNSDGRFRSSGRLTSAVAPRLKPEERRLKDWAEENAGVWAACWKEAVP